MRFHCHTDNKHRTREHIFNRERYGLDRNYNHFSNFPFIFFFQSWDTGSSGHRATTRRKSGKDRTANNVTTRAHNSHTQDPRERIFCLNYHDCITWTFYFGASRPHRPYIDQIARISRSGVSRQTTTYPRRILLTLWLWIHAWLLLARAIGKRSARARGRFRAAGTRKSERLSRVPHRWVAMTTIGFPGIVKTNDREWTRTGRIHLIGCPVKNGTAGAGMCSIDRSIDRSIDLFASSRLSFF